MKIVNPTTCLFVTYGLLCTSLAMSQESTRASELRELSLPAAHRLPDASGEEPIRLFDSRAAKLHVVCFLGTECPLARLYGPRLSELADEFADSGVRVVGVNSNRQDSMQDVRDYVAKYALSFPVAKDYDASAADLLQAKRTPEVVVLDADGKTRYQGRIDDQYLPGIAKSKPTTNDLRDAIVALLDGKEIATPRTTPVGCIIGRQRKLAKQGSVTFCDQVARVLKTHCAECHRSGEIGPFSLTDYDEVVGWGEMMLEVIDDGRMPPWHANPKHGEFLGSREMPESDKQLLREWVRGDMPYGDASKLPEPLPPRVDWSMGTPDVEFEMGKRAFKVPAEGTVDYQYFVLDPGFTEDKWIKAAEVIPGDRSVVHHAIIFVKPPDGKLARGISWLTAYVPGQRVAEFPEGLARHIPAGSKFVFQMHYTPNGTKAEDKTRLGIKFADAKKVTHRVYTLIAMDQQFEIPPQSPNHRVAIDLNLPDTGMLLGVAPHMHLRGKAYRLSTGDREEDILLDVPAYDFNWQHFYAFREPLDVADLDLLRSEIWFNNSASNVVNPDPSQHVTWGDQTWEEMAIAFFEVAEPLDLSKAKRRKRPVIQRDEAMEKQAAQQREARIAAFVDSLFKRFDFDGDGTINRDETSNAFRDYAYWEFENEYDGELTREEVTESARRRFR